MFNLHSSDISDELRILMTELNACKVPLWKQMRIVEVVATILSDELKQAGAQFLMQPDRVIWPDGTITQHPPEGKKKKKSPGTASKHGIYGIIVNDFGSKKKQKTTSLQQSVTVEAVPAVASSSEQVENTKKARRGTFLFVALLACMNPNSNTINVFVNDCHTCHI